MIGRYHIDDLDGPVAMFKSTYEGTETIAVFDEEHREVIQNLFEEIKKLRKLEDVVREAFSENSKYASGEYMNIMGRILGVIENEFVSEKTL